MTRLALAACAVLLLVAVAPAADKPTGPAITDVKLDAKAKLGVKPGKWAEPAQVTTAAELEKLVADKDTRELIGKAVAFKTHNLLVFSWQGSGGDRIEYAVRKSLPEQIAFRLNMGLTDDLRTHARLFAVRKDVRWSAE